VKTIETPPMASGPRAQTGKKKGGPRKWNPPLGQGATDACSVLPQSGMGVPASCPEG
jgi:hypothetical protein